MDLAIDMNSDDEQSPSKSRLYLIVMLPKILDLGRTMGLEPTNGGTTNHCLNHLATLAVLNLTFPILALNFRFCIVLSMIVQEINC